MLENTLLEYDDVMNFQRKIVYERRRKLLLGDDEEVRQVFSKIAEKATPEAAGNY